MDVTDDALMVLYRDGDKAAFHALFDRYRGLVYHFARIMLDDPDLAEDVMQESFLAVSRAAERYEPKGCFRTWLMRIVRNRCLNVLEANRVRQSILAEGGMGIVDFPDKASSGPSPRERMRACEKLSLVERAIQDLPERQREAIVLYAFDSMTYRDIAGALDMPANTVKTLIHRARATLARALKEAGEDGL